MRNYSLKYLKNEREFSIYMWRKMRESNSELKKQDPLKDHEILEMYDKDPIFNSYVNEQYLLKKEKDKKRKHITWCKNTELFDYQEIQQKRIETLGTEGLSNARKKQIETLGPEKLSIIAKKGHETLGHEGRSLRSKKGRETLGPEGCSLVSKKRAITMGKEGLSESLKKGRKTIGKERLSEIHAKGANFICEWSNGELTKGSNATAKLKNIMGLEIINRINITDSEWESYLTKWNEQRDLKQKKKKQESLSPSETQQTIYEWSDNTLTKGSKAKSKKIKEGLNIVDMITIKNPNYEKINSIWKKVSENNRKQSYDSRLKNIKKGTKSNDSRVICPDGHITTSASATKYCRNRGLDRTKCVPAK